MALSKDDEDRIRELIAKEIRDVVKGAVGAYTLLQSAEANYREAQARLVEKTDPARAENIRKIVPEF
jgi:hypothetical protein